MMDFSESTKILFDRIHEFEPENVTKIIGYLLLQDHGNQEIARIASAPEELLHQFILKAKTELQQLTVSSPNPKTPVFSPFSNPNPNRTGFPGFNSPISPFWEPNDPIEPLPGFALPGNEGYFPEAARPNRRPEFGQVKTCHYFNKGYCKHGSSCRYLHGQAESFSSVHGDGFGFGFGFDEQLVSPGSLEKLEAEIIELLKMRRGNPVSIASLPAMYYDKYGKYLQAEGYLTESQRHGKAGYSLTKLLARLKNSIRLIDRPHGQHAVILAEDSVKYLENRTEKSDPGPIVNGSRQIYLTFPAESTFTEEDVSNYFDTFGPVEDVRIPCQQRRMFGFVTFASADTVKLILGKGNPHFVCGSRVLVKPYREKSKLNDRKYSVESQVYYHPFYSDMEAEFHAATRNYENSSLMKKQQQERALEFETRRLSGMHLMRKPLTSQPFFGYAMDELKVSEDQFDFPPTEDFSRLLDVLNCGSTSDDNFKHTDPNYADPESQTINLPDSPFATSMANGISTVI